jgi:cell division protein FtsW (lipid II flippase)
MTENRDRAPIILLQRDRPMRPDLWLVISYLILSAVGLLMIYSASAPRLGGLGIDPAGDLKRQAAFVVLGFITFAAMSMVDTNLLRRYVPAIYGVTIGLLVVVLVFGEKVKGAQRWLEIGPLQFQPSELAKLGVILAIAGLVSSAGKPPLQWDRITRAVLIVAIPAVLIFLQPDLGTMLVLACILVVMLFIGGATLRQNQGVSDHQAHGVPRSGHRSTRRRLQPAAERDRHRHGWSDGEGALRGNPDQPSLRSRAVERLHLHGGW